MKMRAWVLHKNAMIENFPLAIEERDVPSPGQGEILVRIRAAAICRTDLHVIEGDLVQRRLPLVPGHQGVGVVQTMGPSCQRFAIGSRVGIAWLRTTCGRCEFCRRGSENLCERPLFTGYHEDGVFADYAIVPEEYAYAIPPSLEDHQAVPLLCAGIIGFRSLKRCELPEGGTLALFGFGSSAHIVMQVARARGASVVVVTRGERHRGLAREMGATWVGETIEGLPGLADSAIIFAPAGELVPQALSILKRGGTLALAGIHMSQVPPLDYEKHLFYERNVHSVTANTRHDGEELLALASRIPVVSRIVKYPFSKVDQALIDLKTDRIAGTGVVEFGP